MVRREHVRGQPGAAHQHVDGRHAQSAHQLRPRLRSVHGAHKKSQLAKVHGVHN
jgi:hypothetical protein